MIKRLAFGAIAGALALAPLSARADWYVNPELNVGVWFDFWRGLFLKVMLAMSFDNGAYIQAVLP